MADIIERRGALTLLGKRIISTSTQDVLVEQDGEKIEPSHPQSSHTHEEESTERAVKNILVDYDIIDGFYDKYDAMSYYDEETQTVQPMKKIGATFDKSVISNDGEVVTYTVKTTEPMDINITHTIASEGDSYKLYAQPVKGKIVLTFSSELVGTLKVDAIGDTVYTGPYEMTVEGGITL